MNWLRTIFDTVIVSIGFNGVVAFVWILELKGFSVMLPEGINTPKAEIPKKNIKPIRLMEFILYRTEFSVREEVRTCWYGEKEGHMKKAIEKLQRVYPRLTVRCFDGYGHGDIMNHPEQLISELVRFLGQ